MPLTSSNLRALVEWLGEAGARAGLERGQLTVGDLRELAASMNIALPSKASRSELVDAVLVKASQRIDRSIQQLLSMDSGDLLSYFEEVRPSKAELLSVLNELDFHPGSEAQKSLYKYAAIQISETGMFQRVASDKNQQ